MPAEGIVAPAIEDESPPREPSSSSNSITVEPSLAMTRSWLSDEEFEEKLVATAA